MCGKNPDILQLSGPDSNLDTQIQQFSVILLIIKKITYKFPPLHLFWT